MFGIGIGIMLSYYSRLFVLEIGSQEYKQVKDEFLPFIVENIIFFYVYVYIPIKSMREEQTSNAVEKKADGQHV